MTEEWHSSFNVSLLAAMLWQVVVCSFVHGNAAKVTKSKQIVGAKSEDSSEPQHSDKLATPTSAPPSHSHSYNPSGAGVWPGSRQVDLRGPHTGIDLTRGWTKRKKRKLAYATDTLQFLYICVVVNEPNESRWEFVLTYLCNKAVSHFGV